MALVDLDFGLSAQALCILRLLADVDESEVAEWDDEMHVALIDTRTRPWYNGRECGFHIEVSHPTFCRGGENVLHICFAEHKVSDDVIVHHWMDGLYDGGLLVDGVPDEAYVNGKSFKRCQFEQTVNHIKDLMRTYLQTVAVICPVIDS